MIQNINFQNTTASHHLKTNLTKPYNPGEFGKVAVLFGGRSAERSVSLESGQACLEALLRQGVDAHPVDPDEYLSKTLEAGQYDRAFIMLHGKEGEDGVIQAVLEMIGIPYTGSRVAASALAMDKARSKLVMHALDIPTPIFGVANSISEAQYLVETMGLPVSVKPISEGSSLGVSCVTDLKQLPNAFTRAAQYGGVIVEKWVEGTEFFVSILGDEVLPAVSVKPASGFYDFNAKYASDQTEYFCPSGLSPEKEQELKDLSLRAFTALGCEGWGRLDAIQDKQQNFWFLEANTVPGMTSHSLVPMSAKAVGMSFDNLVVAILATSLIQTQVSVGKLAQI